MHIELSKVLLYKNIDFVLICKVVVRGRNFISVCRTFVIINDLNVRDQIWLGAQAPHLAYSSLRLAITIFLSH